MPETVGSARRRGGQFDLEDESPFVGLLQVEAASADD